MTVRSREIPAVPPDKPVRRVHENECALLVAQLKKTNSRVLEVTADRPRELDKFWKALVQWARRHQGLELKIRKRGDLLIVWIDAAQGT